MINLKKFFWLFSLTMFVACSSGETPIDTELASAVTSEPIVEPTELPATPTEVTIEPTNTSVPATDVPPTDVPPTAVPATNTAVPTSAPATNTAVPATNTAEPQATNTWVAPTNTWVAPTVVPQVPATNTLVAPTAVPVINTDVPATPQPTSTAQLQSIPLNSGSAFLRSSADNVTPQDGFTLEWNVPDASSVTIKRSGGEFGELDDLISGTGSGSRVETFGNTIGGWPVVYQLTADNGAELELIVNLSCQYEWVIGTPPAGCPEQSVVSAAAQQDFEGGFMIWIQAQDTILVSSYDGLTHWEFDDEFEESTHPISDPSIVSPAGLYQPEYGFGKIWRENANVRQMLGWGTDWGADYTVKRQRSPNHRYGSIEFISMRNGGLITIEPPSPMWQVNYMSQNGYPTRTAPQP